MPSTNWSPGIPIRTKPMAPSCCFVSRFPTNEFTPLAQWWVADFYFNTGAYAAAETNYQAIAANWPKSEFTFRARLMAGRAAVGRLSWDNAARYYYWPLATNP